MPLAEPSQITFIGGLNAQAAPDKLGDGECVTATNIDFSLTPGAATVRRGSVVNNTIIYSGSTSTAPIVALFRNYNIPTSLGDSPYYAVTTGGCYRTTTNTWTRISTTGSTENVGITSFGPYTVLSPAYGTYIKDDGTNYSDWIKQAPTNAVALSTIVYSTQSYIAGGSVIDGTGTYTGGTWTGTSTDTSVNRIVFEGTMSSTDLSLLGTAVIGDYGVDYLKIAVSEPGAVLRVSRDYSIGDASFTNYFHAETFPAIDAGTDLLPGVETYLEDQPIVSGDTSEAIHIDQRKDILDGGKVDYTRPATEGMLGRSPSTFYTWAVARPNFQLIGKSTSTSGASPWSNIAACRVIIECSSTVIAKVGDWYIQGDTEHALSDPIVGYNYWVTFATLDSDGLLLDESSPSPVLSGVRLSQGKPILTHIGTATGSHGITHRIFYRQGGLLQQPYAVSTQTALSGTSLISTATLTDTLADIKALSKGYVMPGDGYSASTFPNQIAGGCEFQGCLFVFHENILRWTSPGKVGTFPKLNWTEVSSVGDEIQAIQVYGNNLIIVNRDSVYILQGSIFEGADQNWVLRRSSSRHGCKAPRVANCRTPFGIPLLDYDGLTMFDPGSGYDTELDWLHNKLGDIFKGTATTDPAYIKGDRVAPINKSYIRNSFAVYTDGKLYLAVPTNSYQQPYTVYVIEFASRRVWLYNYGYRLTTGFWDFVDNKLLFTAHSAGRVVQVETGQYDQTPVLGSDSTLNPITYVIKPKMITAPTDFRMENMIFEMDGGTSTVSALFDGTSTTTLGTFTSAVRDWTIPPFNGSAVNNVQLVFNGQVSTASSANLYGVGFSAIPEPQQVRYFRTEYYNNEHTGESLWDVHHASLDIVGTGTITGVAFLDGTAVMTNTYVGPTNGRTVFHRAYPANQYGNIAFTTYTSTADSLRIKHFDTWYNARKEPAPVNSYQSDWTSLDENICDAHNVDINPNGTVTATVFVDNVAINTFTYTGTARQSYVSAITNETYGRTIFAKYSGSNFKLYNVWWDLRPEPDRMTNFVATRESRDENIFYAVNVDMNPLGGTTTGIVYVDGTAVSTCTMSGSLRQSFVHALPDETYGRTIWVAYTALSTAKFKHFNTWFDAVAEPDRLTNFVTARESKDENWFRNINWDMNPLGGVVYGTVYVDGTVVATSTATGSVRQSFVMSLPDNTMGRTIWVAYSGVLGGKFKHYNTWFDATPEPDRISLWHERIPYASENYIKTWIAELNPLGTAIGTLMVDGTAVWTNTFTGTRHQVYNVGVDVAAFTAQTTGTVVDVIYNGASGARLKHYNTQLEAAPKPFGKKTWQIVYNKSGGASRVDTARSFSLDIETVGTSTITSVWYVDGRAYNTNTLTFTGREWREWIPLPPDGRGYLFHQELKSTIDFRVWSSTLDMLREGAKGVARGGHRGTPS